MTHSERRAKIEEIDRQASEEVQFSQIGSKILNIVEETRLTRCDFYHRHIKVIESIVILLTEPHW